MSETTARERLDGLLRERIVVLDGAWGTMLQGLGLGGRDLRGDPDVLNLTRPDVVLDIHRAYFAAGADVTTTNTFTATSIGQAEYGLQSAVYDLNVAGARLARRGPGQGGGG